MLWCGWGRIKAIGYGMRLEEQREDNPRMASPLPVCLDENAKLNGALTIPSDLILIPLVLQANTAQARVVSVVNVRKLIIKRLKLFPYRLLSLFR